MRTLLVLAGLLVIASGGSAQAADEWGIEHEEVTRFDAKVVDILCELSGDCPANCGDGRRQLGLLRDDGKLILVAKNADPFAGAVADLLPFCGRTITADGLLINDPLATLMVLQFKRPAPDGQWSRGNWFSRDWAEAQGVARDSAKARQWFRNDPMVTRAIERDGVFGIPGLEPSQ